LNVRRRERAGGSLARTGTHRLLDTPWERAKTVGQQLEPRADHRDGDLRRACKFIVAILQIVQSAAQLLRLLAAERRLCLLG
jgi:hypothetical protein